MLQQVCSHPSFGAGAAFFRSMWPRPWCWKLGREVWLCRPGAVRCRAAGTVEGEAAKALPEDLRPLQLKERARSAALRTQ